LKPGLQRQLPVPAEPLSHFQTPKFTEESQSQVPAQSDSFFYACTATQTFFFFKLKFVFPQLFTPSFTCMKLATFTTKAFVA
jgi:hypothetical protein